MDVASVQGSFPLVPHPFSDPNDGSLTYMTNDPESVESLTELLEGFKSYSNGPKAFDYTKSLMEVNDSGTPTLAGGTITLAPGAFTACGENSTIAFLDANLFKMIEKAKTIDSDMSALAWTTELQTFSNNVVNNLRDNLNIQSIDDILDQLPEPVGSIAEDLIKVGLLMESVKDGGIDLVTLNKVMSAFDTDYKDVLNGLGLDANKVLSTLGDLQRAPVSTILSESGLCNKIPNIAKIVTDGVTEVKELLGETELAVNDVETEELQEEDRLVISAENASKSIEKDLEEIKSMMSDNLSATENIIPDYNSFVGENLAIDSIFRFAPSLKEDAESYADNQSNKDYYDNSASLNEMASAIEASIPSTLPGMVDNKKTMDQIDNFLNSKDNPGGASGPVIGDLMNNLISGIPNLNIENIEDPQSLISAIKSKMPDIADISTPKGVMNLDDRSENASPYVNQIRAHSINKEFNEFLDNELVNINRDRLIKYSARRKINGLTPLSEDNAESMWKNDPYFTIESIKTAAGYDNLEPKSEFTTKESDLLLVKFNKSKLPKAT